MIALVFWGILGFAACDLKCMDGWDQGHKSCFKVIDYRTDWVTAFMYCSAMRSQLAEIDSQEEQNAVADILKKYVYVKKGQRALYEQFWINLSDMKEEGQFQWMTFNNNATYTNWIQGQPDNNGGNPAENCVHVNAKPHRHFCWNDHNCGAQLNFICEAFPVEESTITA